jgi:ADP-ribose pyrophosphatase YjhB (NUDIX family)
MESVVGDTESEPKWVKWSRRLMAIAQNGLTYAENHFDRERYEQIRAVAAEMMAEQSEMDDRKVIDLFSGEIGYATPKVDVRGAVFRDDQILLVKERVAGLWTLPGGWADVNESPKEAVVREVMEESGYHTRATKLLAVWDRAKHPHNPPFPYHIYRICILCELVGGEAATSHETEEVGFYPEDRLPGLSISRVTPGQIARLFEHHRDPDLPTDCD